MSRWSAAIFLGALGCVEPDLTGQWSGTLRDETTGTEFELDWDIGPGHPSADGTVVYEVSGGVLAFGLSYGDESAVYVCTDSNCPLMDEQSDDFVGLALEAEEDTRRGSLRHVAHFFEPGATEPHSRIGIVAERRAGDRFLGSFTLWLDTSLTGPAELRRR